MDRLVCMEAFVRVAEAESFAGAARRWGRSTTVVSKYISQLEEHLGVALLQRSTRSVALTEAGRRHYENTQQVLALLTDSETQLQEADASTSGVLRISAPSGLLSMGRPSLVASFLRRFPEVELDLDVTYRMVDLIEDRVDVAIRVTQPEDSSLIARKLAPVRLVLIATPDYLRRNGVPASPEELVEHRCLVDGNFKFQHRWPFRVDGELVHAEVSGPVRANDMNTLLTLALEGLGIAMLPRPIALPYLLAGTLSEVLPQAVDVSWCVYAITPQRRLLPQRARAFIGHLKRFLPNALSGESEA